MEPEIKFTNVDAHRLRDHDIDMPEKRIASYLGLKPNTCYAKVEKDVLCWVRATKFYGPMDMTNLYKYEISVQKDVQEVHRYNKNGIVALVFLYHGDCILLLSASGIKQKIVVEGVRVPLASYCWGHSSDVMKYYLRWGRETVVPDWLL